MLYAPPTHAPPIAVTHPPSNRSRIPQYTLQEIVHTQYYHRPSASQGCRSRAADTRRSGIKAVQSRRMRVERWEKKFLKGLDGMARRSAKRGVYRGLMPWGGNRAAPRYKDKIS